MRWVILSLLMARVAAAQALEEHVDPDLPDYVLKTAELADGRVLVLGGMIGDEGWPRVDRDERRVVLAGAALPDVGEPRDITSGDGVAWILGDRAVAALTGTVWKRVALTPQGAPATQVVALDATHALVLRGRLVQRIDLATAQVEVSIEAPGHAFVAAVADGSGGAWAVLRKPSWIDGVPAHYAAGSWSVYASAATSADLAGAGFHVVDRPHATVRSYGELSPDGHGGWFSVGDTGVEHFTSDGKRPTIAVPAGSRPTAVEWNAARGRLVGVHLPERRMLEAPRLVELDLDGNVLTDEPIPTPAWYREQRELAARPWAWVSGDSVAVDSLLYTRGAGRWRVAYSPALLQRAQRLATSTARARSARLRSSVLTEAGLVAGSVLVGTLGASAVHADARAGYVMLGGTLGALAPELLIDELLPGPWNDEVTGEPGMPRVASAALVFAHWAGFVGGVVGTIGLGGAGAYEAGQLGERTPPSDAAVLGSLVGSAVGTAGSVALTSWLERRWPERHWLRVAVGSTVIGACASLGYQLGARR